MKTNIQTTWLDYPDNSSLAIILYTYGCIHNCKNCQNKELQTPIKVYPETIIKDIYEYCLRNNTNKLVLSGGDCLLKNVNLDLTNRIIRTYKYKLDICLYTGYDIEYVKKYVYKGFKFVKCGKYEESLKTKACKTDEYIQFASTNQQLYNFDYKLLSSNGRYYFKQGETK